MAQQLKLAVIGDPHIAVPRGADDTRLEADPGRKLHGLSVELLQATIQAVNQESGVSAALIMGDLTRDSELFNHEIARSLLAGLRMPYYFVLGNHDLKRQRPAGAAYESEVQLDRDEVLDYYRDRGFPAGMSRYVKELDGGIVLVVLDSNRSLTELALAGEPVNLQEDGWIGEQQLAWLDAVLSQITCKHRLPLVAMHHALLEQSPAERPGHMLYTAFKHWRALDAAALIELLTRHRVPLVLSGHLHAQSVNVHSGLYNVVTSAAVSYPHAWRLVTFAGGQIHLESRKLAAIPSCEDLQRQSHQWMTEGMGLLIKQRVSGMPMVGGMAGQLCDFVNASGWWPRFCDGTLAGFQARAEEFPNNNPLSRVLANQVAYTLSEYGTWKSSRPDPNMMSIPLQT